MKEMIIVFLGFVIFFGTGVVVYYSGYPQTGEGIALISCIGLLLRSFSFSGR
jgi:hypothetical protein